MASVVMLSCGEVPTLPEGVAYISGVVLPSPAVAAGEQLRDSAGVVAPLRVIAYDRNDRPVAGVVPLFVVSSVPAGVTIDANGILTADDSVRTIQIVGRLGDRLQTPPLTLQVVAQPDSIVRTGSLDSITATRSSSPLSASVTGLRRGTRIAVGGIIVRYQIVATYPARPVSAALAVFDVPLAGDPTRAVDTTDASGTVSRAIVPVTLSGLDSVEVRATALSLRGMPLRGSPLRFILPVKRGG